MRRHYYPEVKVVDVSSCGHIPLSINKELIGVTFAPIWNYAEMLEEKAKGNFWKRLYDALFA